MQVGSTKVQCYEDDDNAATIFFYSDNSCQNKVPIVSVQAFINDDGVAIPNGCNAINQTLSYTITCDKVPGGNNFPVFAIALIIVFVCLCCCGTGTFSYLKSKRKCWFAEKGISQGTEMRQSYRINDGHVISPIILQGKNSENGNA